MRSMGVASSLDLGIHCAQIHTFVRPPCFHFTWTSTHLSLSYKIVDCTPIFGEPGFCCGTCEIGVKCHHCQVSTTSLAIGTICFDDVDAQVLSCIDAYGNLTSPSPADSLGVVPPATPIANSDQNVKFLPLSAWSSNSTTAGDPSCRDSRVTSSTNSTVSFNYTGK